MRHLSSGLFFCLACAGSESQETDSTRPRDTGDTFVDSGAPHQDSGHADTDSGQTDDDDNTDTGTVLIDLQPGIWPNIISSGDDIVVAVLARNGFEPKQLTTETISLWNVDGTVSLAASEDLGSEDVDGDGFADHLFGFPYSPDLFEGSGPIELRANDWSAIDHFVDDTRLSFVYPDLQGPYKVGTATDEWEDTDRPDERTEGVEYRRLPIQIWYPADVPTNAQPSAHYLKRDESITIANFLGIFSRYFDYLFSHAHLNAPISTEKETWPVLVFSHGYGVQLPNQTALVQNAASHGFIVVGLQHTYSTAYTFFEDGTIATAYIDPTIDTEATQNMWTEDLQFVLDRVEELNHGEDSFAGRIDLDRMGVFGYSFGGSTAAELCRIDSRVLAGLNIDGTFWGDTQTGFDSDFLLINAAANFETGSREDLLNSVRGTAYNLTIPDARHANFNDYALQDEYISALIGGGYHGLDIGSIDSRLAYQIVHAYIAAFFSQHVAGDPTKRLTGDSKWDEAIFEIWQ